MFKDVRLFLSKFNAIKPPERAIVEDVIKVIVHVLGITVRRAEISVRGRTVYITTTPVIKSEIVLNKSKILRELSKSNLVGRAVKDIR